MALGPPSPSSFARRGAPPIVALLLLALASPSAFAEEVSRDSYKAAVEPICQTNAAANARLLKGVRAEVRTDRLAEAGGRLLAAAAALQKTYDQLAAVPQPPEDEVRLGKWLGYVKREQQLFAQAGKSLKAGRKAKASGLSIKLNNNATLANNSVLPFGFHFCRFEPSKYT